MSFQGFVERLLMSLSNACQTQTRVLSGMSGISTRRNVPSFYERWRDMPMLGSLGSLKATKGEIPRLVGLISLPKQNERRGDPSIFKSWNVEHIDAEGIGLKLFNLDSHIRWCEIDLGSKFPKTSFLRAFYLKRSCFCRNSSLPSLPAGLGMGRRPATTRRFQERDRKRRVKQRWEKGLGGATVTPWKVRGTSHGKSWMVNRLGKPGRSNDVLSFFGRWCYGWHNLNI